MGKGRLEAFSDGVFAVIITIMVLELKAPHTAELSALVPIIPAFMSYVLSFVMVGIYWNNHHHIWQASRHVNGFVLLANMNLLFWLSLFPFVTAWMGENEFAPVPAAAFGTVALMSALSYTILSHSLMEAHGKDSAISQAIGRDFKGWISIALYVTAIFISGFGGIYSFALYATVAMIWIIPDRRIERALSKQG
jgi:uncharacterized membrane protein